MTEIDLVGGLIPFEISSLFTFTRIADSTEPSSFEFSFFPNEKKLKINSGHGFPLDISITYNLLISNKAGARFSQNPQSVSGETYLWPPRLKQAPKVTESAQNVLEGIITLNNINIEILTDDSENLRVFFGSENSIMNQKFKIWRVTNSGSILKIYEGVGRDLSSKPSGITYSAVPKISQLEKPATYNLDDSWPFGGVNEPKVIPIICAAVIPYTVSTVTNQDVTYQISSNTFLTEGERISWATMSKDTLVSMPYQYSSNTIRAYQGITFWQHDLNDFDNCAVPTDLGVFSPGGSDPVAVAQSSKNHNFFIPSFHASPTANTDIDFIPGDSFDAVYDNLQTTIGVLQWLQGRTLASFFARYVYFCLTQRILTDFISFFADKRYKVMFTPKSTYNQAAAKNNINHQVSSVLESNGRFIPSSRQSGTVQTKRPFTSARITRVDYLIEPKSNNRSLANLYQEFDYGISLVSSGELDLFLQWHMQHDNPKLSVQNFFLTTINEAGFLADVSELNSTDYMQFIGDSTMTYKDIIEKLLTGIGYFLSYDSNADIVRLVRIDDTKPNTMTIGENDFSNLTVKLKTSDTYKKVEFINTSMQQGENTRDQFSGLKYYEQFTASSQINETNKTKTIEMLTMESSRAANIAKFHLDNKFEYSFEVPATDEFLSVNLGDWIVIQSNQTLEASGQARILLLKKEIGETSIKCSGFKFASVN